jgi:hypothetical protein
MEGFRFLRFPNFERIATVFDVLHLTEKGLDENFWHFEFMGWDREYTVWSVPSSVKSAPFASRFGCPILMGPEVGHLTAIRIRAELSISS